jgi:hypothetical protein
MLYVLVSQVVVDLNNLKEVLNIILNNDNFQ